MLVIGLTGGVGSGKSTVSNYLAELGATLIDADKVGHEAYLPDTPAYKDIAETFGPTVVGPDGQIDRKALGGIVFSDRALLDELNAIVWPRLRDMILERIEGLRGEGAEGVVVEAAVLIEANWMSLVDEVWVTAAPEDTVVERVMARNDWGEEQIRARIRSQISHEERVKHADVVIDTDGSLDDVKRKVRALWDERRAVKN